MSMKRRTKLSQPIETRRLIIRPFVDDDAEAAFAGWFGDPEAMRFTPSGPDRTVADTRRRLAMYRHHQASEGFSKWLVQDKASGEPIGDSGLLILDGARHADLGLRIACAHRGRGLATEVVSGWCHSAFDVLAMDRLTAFSHPDNGALRHLFEKIGFELEGSSTVMDMQALVFVLEADAFRLEDPID